MNHFLRLGLILWTAFMAFFPLLNVLPGPDLDGGWIMVLGEARHHGWIFGRDIVFTGGPLSPLYTGYLADGDFLLLAGLRLVLAAGMARFLWLLFKDAPFILLLPALGLLSGNTYMAGLADPLFLALPFLFALVVLARPPAESGRMTLALGIAVTAVISLVKFSTIVIALPAFLLLDLRSLTRRSPPFLSVTYVAAMAVIFTALEGNPSAFGGFLYYSSMIAAGYGDAMGSYFGNSLHIELFALAAILLLFFMFGNALIRRRRGEALTDVVIRAVISLLFLYLAAKAGFLRHDPPHEPTAWAALILLAIIEANSWWSRSNGAGRPYLYLGIIACALGVPIILAVASTSILERSEMGIADAFRGIDSRLVTVGRFVASPSAWLAAQRKAHEAALQQIRANVPMPGVEGSIDIVSSKQAALIAYGLHYQPRPSVQEYAAYNAPLIEANRHALIGESGPGTLLVEPGSIDGRYPSLAEGPLWPDILRTFKPTEFEDGLVVMERREAPLPDLLRDVAVGQAVLGEPVHVGESRNAIFLSLSVRKTLIGSLLSLLLKPNPLMIEVETNTGRHFTHRLIPAIAEAGFVLSPYIASSEDFWALSRGLPQGSAIETVKSFRVIEQGWWSSLGIDAAVFRSNLAYRLQEIALDPLRKRATIVE